MSLRPALMKTLLEYFSQSILYGFRKDLLPQLEGMARPAASQQQYFQGLLVWSCFLFPQTSKKSRKCQGLSRRSSTDLVSKAARIPRLHSCAGDVKAGLCLWSSLNKAPGPTFCETFQILRSGAKFSWCCHCCTSPSSASIDGAATAQINSKSIMEGLSVRLLLRSEWNMKTYQIALARLLNCICICYPIEYIWTRKMKLFFKDQFSKFWWIYVMYLLLFFSLMWISFLSAANSL